MKKPKTRPARTSRSTPFVLRLLRFLSDFFSLSLFLYFFFDVFGHSPHTQTATYEREHILPYIGQRNASIVGHECCTRAYVSKLMSVCVCVWWCKLQCSPLQHYRRFVRCACAHLYRLSICVRICGVFVWERNTTSEWWRHRKQEETSMFWHV